MGSTLGLVGIAALPELLGVSPAVANVLWTALGTAATVNEAKQAWDGVQQNGWEDLYKDDKAAKALLSAGLTALPAYGAVKQFRMPGSENSMNNSNYLRLFDTEESAVSKSRIMNPKYFDNTSKQYNMQNIKDDISNGFTEANQILQSKLRQQVEAHNEEIARRLGYQYEAPGLLGSNRAALKPQFSLQTNMSDNELGNVIYDVNPSKDLVNINVLSDDYATTVFHENLHRGGYGWVPYLGPKLGENEAQFKKRIKDSMAFMRLKTAKLLDKQALSKIPEFESYFLDSNTGNELAVNLMELGRRANIKPGTPYPGDEQFYKLLETLAKDPEKGNIINVLNLDRPRLIWEALTGKYFSLIAPISIGAAGAYSSSKHPQQYDNN